MSAVKISSFAPLDRNAVAKRCAADIPEGWCVNLGIGMPTLVADHVPASREVIFHSENGLLGMGPAPNENEADPWVVNAGKQNVSMLRGASLFHHADSFAMIRGGHLDLCLLGAYEIAQNGDIANWATSDAEAAPAVGGAMDLAAGAKRLWVMTEHLTKDGRSKLVERCSYPLTALGAVKRIYTNLAVIDVTPRGFEVVEILAAMSFDQLQGVTAAKLHPASA